jgi:integrase
LSSITKMPNGRWRARYRDPNGRSRSRTFSRKQDAQDFLDDTSTDARRGEWIDPCKSRETFDTWADRWWRTTVKFRPTTRRGWHGLLERHVRPYFTGRKVTEIDWADVEEFIASKLEAGLSPKYVREAVSVLSLVMQLAVNSKVRRDNPAAGHRLPVRQRKIRQGDVLSMEQAHRLVEAVPGPYKSAVWMLMLTGMRPAELCGLRVSSVDLLRGEVRVTESLLPVHKFGDQPYHRDVTGPTKTEAGDRGIPIPRWLADDLATMLAERAERRGQPVDPSEHLFQTRYGNPVNRDKFREKVMRPALRAAGLPESIRTYDLRHSHASLLIELGASALAVAQRLGHTDPAMTLRVYGHLFEGVQERLTDQLDALRETTAGTATTADVVDLSGHNQDTRDTRKTRNRGHVRCTSVKSG